MLGDHSHVTVYTRNPRNLDSKNGSVNLVQSGDDMFINIKIHIIEK